MHVVKIMEVSLNWIALKWNLRPREERLTTETEELAVLQLRVAQLRQALKDRIVVAPIDGQVTEIHREVGELVTVNAPEIVRIVDISKLRARFYLTEQEVDKLPKDRTVAIELASGKNVSGTIEDVAPVADKESGLIVVSVLIDNLNSDIGARAAPYDLGNRRFSTGFSFHSRSPPIRKQTQ